jgi:acetyltransferase-like isoleucine patch superfamily enzyme
MAEAHIDPTAEVDLSAVLGDDVQIWNWTKVREGARIGARCRLGQGVYVDHGVHVGTGCKVQNGVSIYAGVTLGDDVFVGPHATFTNDRVPRADADDWTIVPTVVEDHVSIGANATIVCGVRLGRACMVGAGAVVVADVPAHALVVGNPARVVDYVRLDGSRLDVGADISPERVQALVA